MCGADPELTGQTVQPHPGLTQGPASDYEYKQLLEGSVYVRLDMPGVSEDNVNININDLDSGGRSYSAVAALRGPSACTFTPPLESNVENGVVCLFIHPA
ncbi:hypothetical protein F2Q70_00032660 [Brassica cretica]|uniref:SHSP domain-containing protein n=1 Tax=Brassica cretica TaxID=69181 RepID=A0A8S9FL11_BRACR|nr:hypothetical protein F2Q70_00032660 [Brassica cretica]